MFSLFDIRGGYMTPYLFTTFFGYFYFLGTMTHFSEFFSTCFKWRLHIHQLHFLGPKLCVSKIYVETHTYSHFILGVQNFGYNKFTQMFSRLDVRGGYMTPYLFTTFFGYFYFFSTMTHIFQLFSTCFKWSLHIVSHDFWGPKILGTCKLR